MTVGGPRPSQQRPAGDARGDEDALAAYEFLQLEDPLGVETGFAQRLRLLFAAWRQTSLHVAAERARHARGHDPFRSAAHSHEEVRPSGRQQRREGSRDVAVRQCGHTGAGRMQAADQILVARLVQYHHPQGLDGPAQRLGQAREVVLGLTFDI